MLLIRWTRYSLPDRVKHVLKTLVEALESALLPHPRRFVERDAAELDQFFSSERVDTWSCILSLTRWLGMNCTFNRGYLVIVPDSLLAQAVSTPFAPKLATLMIRSENSARPDSKICSSVLRLLFEELWCVPDVSHRVHLDVLVSFYAVNGGDRGSDGASFLFHVFMSF